MSTLKRPSSKQSRRPRASRISITSSSKPPGIQQLIQRILQSSYASLIVQKNKQFAKRWSSNKVTTLPGPVTKLLVYFNQQNPSAHEISNGSAGGPSPVYFNNNGQRMWVEDSSKIKYCLADGGKKDVKCFDFDAVWFQYPRFAIDVLQKEVVSLVEEVAASRNINILVYGPEEIDKSSILFGELYKLGIVHLYMKQVLQEMMLYQKIESVKVNIVCYSQGQFYDVLTGRQLKMVCHEISQLFGKDPTEDGRLPEFYNKSEVPVETFKDWIKIYRIFTSNLNELGNQLRKTGPFYPSVFLEFKTSGEGHKQSTIFAKFGYDCNTRNTGKKTEGWGIKFNNLLRDKDFYLETPEQNDPFVRYIQNFVYRPATHQYVFLALNSTTCLPSQCLHCLQFSASYLKIAQRLPTQFPNKAGKLTTQKTQNDLKQGDNQNATINSSSALKPSIKSVTSDNMLLSKNNYVQTKKTYISQRTYLLSRPVLKQLRTLGSSPPPSHESRPRFKTQRQTKQFLKLMQHLWTARNKLSVTSISLLTKLLQTYDKIVQSERETFLFDLRALSNSEVKEALSEQIEEFGSAEKNYMELVKKAEGYLGNAGALKVIAKLFDPGAKDSNTMCGQLVQMLGEVGARSRSRQASPKECSPQNSSTCIGKEAALRTSGDTNHSRKNNSSEYQLGQKHEKHRQNNSKQRINGQKGLKTQPTLVTRPVTAECFVLKSNSNNIRTKKLRKPNFRNRLENDFENLIEAGFNNDRLPYLTE